MFTTTFNYLDLLYFNKNKAYGSYELRKNYHKRSLLALALVLLGTACIAWVYNYAHTNNATITESHTKKSIVLTEVILPSKKDIVLPERKPTKQPDNKPQAAQSMKKYTDPKVVANDKVLRKDKIDVATLKEDIAAGPKNHTGPSDATLYYPVANKEDNGTGGDKLVVEKIDKPKPVDNKPHRSVNKKPVFQGNVQDYLRSQLKYPPKALEAGITGTVKVEFVVSSTGQISQVKALNAIGGGCEQEAVRVVKSMKGWQPGEKDGIPVDAYFTISVQFKLK